MGAKGNDRVNARGAAGRQPARDKGDSDEHQRDGDKGKRIVVGDSEELTAHKAGERGGEESADSNTRDHHAEALAKDKQQDLAALGTESDSDANFLGALADQIGD